MLSRSDLDLLMTQAKDGLLHRRYDQVIESTTEVLKHDAKRLTAYLLRAEALRKQGLNDRAMADLAVAIRLDPNQPQPYVIRAEILKRQNRLDQAIADTTQAILLNPNLATAYAIRGECRRLIGDVEGARQDAEELFRLDPTRSIGPAPPQRSDPPTPRFETEEDSLKPTAARRVGDGSELFVDGKPVDRSLNLRKPVRSDHIDPLADAADYRPEVMARPIPRIRARRRTSQTPLLVGLGIVCAVLAGFILAQSNREPKPTTPTLAGNVLSCPLSGAVSLELSGTMLLMVLPLFVVPMSCFSYASISLQCSAGARRVRHRAS